MRPIAQNPTVHPAYTDTQDTLKWIILKWIFHTLVDLLCMYVHCSRWGTYYITKRSTIQKKYQLGIQITRLWMDIKQHNKHNKATTQDMKLTFILGWKQTSKIWLLLCCFILFFEACVVHDIWKKDGPWYGRREGGTNNFLTTLKWFSNYYSNCYTINLDLCNTVLVKLYHKKKI